MTDTPQAKNPSSNFVSPTEGDEEQPSAVLPYQSVNSIWRWQDHLENIVIIVLLVSISGPLLLLGALFLYIRLDPRSDLGGDLKFSIALIAIGTVMLVMAAIVAIGLRRRNVITHANPRH